MKKVLAVAGAFVAFAFMGINPSAGAAPQPADEASAQACFTRGGGSSGKWNFNYCDRGPVNLKTVALPDGDKCQVGYTEWWRQRSFDLRIKNNDSWMCIDGWTKVNDGAYWDDSNPICVRVFMQNRGGGYTEWGSASCG
ncbi:hypothetical protein ACFWN2_43665 [Lentzea sp. NPDC058436]|uniref:hypothetical protein n=1 Tax=Lentzea sp. NPDC058436 TaxID=3346499 RepID=UPI0036492B5A